MNKAQLDNIEQWFRRYVRPFTDCDGDEAPLYLIKVEHSQRVAREMRQLARALDWPASEVNLAEAIGWLHDVGRFTQFLKFGTFHDGQSLNHGEHGWELLLELGVLSALTRNEQARVLEAVRYHNAKSLPDHLQDQSLRMARLIRDADKLDIFHIVHDAFVRDGFQDLPRMLPQIELEGAINPKLLDQLRRDRVCSFGEVKSLNDFLLLQLSWVYDIHYVPTFQQIDQRHILAYIADKLPKNDCMINQLLSDAEHYVVNRINEGNVPCREDQALTKRLRRAFNSIKPSDELVQRIRIALGRVS